MIEENFQDPTNVKESPRCLGSIRIVGKDSSESNQLAGSLSFRQFTEEEILCAANTILQESVGNAATVTTEDIYSLLLGSRGSRAWENEASRKNLTPQKIGHILTRAGFINVMPPRRSARYKAP